MKKGFCKFGNGFAYNPQDKSTLMAGNNNVEINKKDIGEELAEKIVILETKVMVNQSTDTIKAKEASAIMKTHEEVINKKR